MIAGTLNYTRARVGPWCPVGFGRTLKLGSTGLPVRLHWLETPTSAKIREKWGTSLFISFGGQKTHGDSGQAAEAVPAFFFGLRENSLAAEGREMMRTARMERPIDEIRKAEAAMQELLAAAGELRRLIDLACAENPEETAELRKAASALEKEVQQTKDSLQRWRQSIQ